MEGEYLETGRIVSPGFEKHLGKKVDVLDHGFVRLVDYMGGDDSIVQSARVSYGKGTKKVSEDRGLIRYLMRHRHTTPFEMVEMKWHVKTPIFVARQWIRHRTANVNEYSLRYSEPEKDFYIPNPGEIRLQSVTNRQGSSEEDVSPEIVQKVIAFLETVSEDSFEEYGKMKEDGIAKELARIGLPINLYTQFYWKNDLHNTMHFLGLRMDKHSQYEIQEYANAMAGIVKEGAPHSWEAFEDYVLNAQRFSALELNVMRRVFSGDDVDVVAKEIITGKRERDEFLEKWVKLKE